MPLDITPFAPSQIDPTKPEFGEAYTADVRQNFLYAQEEIDALQGALNIVIDPTASPFLQLSGGTMTGPLTLAADPTAPLQAATKQYVDAQIGARANVSSVAGKTGDVTLVHSDISDWFTVVPLASQALPLPASLTGAVGISFSYSREDHRHPTDLTRAPLNNANLTGIPTAPTAPQDTNSPQIASTSFVLGQGSLALPVMNGSAAPGSAVRFSRADHVHPTDSSLYPTSNPLGFQTLAGVNSAILSFRGSALPVAAGNASAGNAQNYSREDHRHPTDVNVLGVAVPLMNGSPFAGLASFASREDHVHPIDTSRYAASNPLGFQTGAQVSAALTAFVPLSQRGVAGGVATLDTSGLVPSTQLPAALTGTPVFLGAWNPTTNTPTLATGGLLNGLATTRGSYFICSVNGPSVPIDGNSAWNAGDWVSSSGTAWQRIQTSSNPYLPLSGGTVTGPITAPTFVLANADTWTTTSPLEPDLTWSLRGLGGNIPVGLDTVGNFVVASIIALSGQITLSADPTTPLGAATKQYADNLIPPLYSNALPLAPVIGGAPGTALTFARSDHRHPGDAQGAPLTSPMFITSVDLQGTGETWLPSIEPDWLWRLSDTAGNIAVALDYTGQLLAAAINVGTLAAGSFSMTGALSVSAVTATSITIQGDAWNDAGLIPDLVGTVRGANGNIVFGFDALTGETNVASINAGALKVNGLPFSAATVRAPSDAFDVTAAPYSAKGDGQENYSCLVTASGTSLTVINYTGTATLAQNDATTALLTLNLAKWSGWGFQLIQVGHTVHLVNTDTGAVLDAVLVQYQDPQNVLLAAANVVPFTNANVTVLAPSFQPTDVGKWLIVEGMGKNIWWGGSDNFTRSRDDLTPYGRFTWMGTITAYVAANQVTVNAAFPLTWANVPTRIKWGTNDSDAVARAARDGFNAGYRKIWFPGANRLYIMPNLLVAGPGRINYNPLPVPVITDSTIALNGMQWWGDNARLHACDSSALQFRNRIAQVGAPAYKQIEKRVHGKISFPRCAQLQTINLLIIGDSQGSFNPEAQSAIIMPGSRYVEEFIAQNPGKKINVYNVAIGGATYQSFASPANLINNNSNPVQYWTCPKPVVGTWKWSDFLTNVNRSATTSTNPIVPDVVLVMNCGGNDSITLDMLSFNAVINLIRAIPHSDGFGPTDLILQTDAAARLRSNAFTQGGTPLPDPWTRLEWWEYATVMQRGVALNRGYGILDQAPIVERSCFGYDVSHRAQRQVMQQTITPTPAVPVSLATQGHDYSFWMTTPAASDAAAWQNMHQLDIGLSQNETNRLMIRVINGNFWLAQSSNGLVVSTVVTMTQGSTALQVGAPDLVYVGDFTFFYRWFQLALLSLPGTLTSALVDRCVVGNFGNGGGQNYDLARNYVRRTMDGNNVLCYEASHDYTDVAGQTNKTINFGGQRFIPIDGVALPDVWFEMPDGSIFQTKIASYIDATHVTLRDPAPATLNAQAVPMFLGVMGIPWTDTGRTVSTTTNTGVVDIGWNRNYMNFGYSEDMLPVQITELNYFHMIEKYGGLYNPVFRVWGSTPQQLVLSNIYVDEDFQFAPTCTPWEIRSDASPDFWMYGGGGHSGSRFRTEVIDPICASVNFTTSG